MDSEIVREALIDLDRSREKEHVLRQQANNLLEGLEIIVSASSTEDMLGRLLRMVVDQLACDDAFILTPEDPKMEGGWLNCIAATHEVFGQEPWQCGQVFRRVLQGKPVMLFSVKRIEEWQQQSEAVQNQSESALLISFSGVDRPILIVCLSRQRAYFNKLHLALMQRLAPIASHALHTLYINEQLRQEIDERNRIEQYASFQAGIAEMSASVLHNIGNAITGAQGNVIKIERYNSKLTSLIPVLGRLAQWIEEGEVEENREKSIQLLHGISKVLEDVTGTEGEIAHEIKALERASYHVSEIIQSQRGLSRPILTASEFLIEDMVHDALAMVEQSLKRYGVELEFDLVAPLEALHLPRNPMIQMMLNFLKNSLESIQERINLDARFAGKIVIRFRYLSERDGQKWVELEIKDNGVGVEVERLHSIFHFGESSKERGSGFGLHSAANFVKGQSGSIRLESDGANRGARVVVELPQ